MESGEESSFRTSSQESEVQMQRGVNGERKGLKAAEAAEQKRAKQQKTRSHLAYSATYPLRSYLASLCRLPDF